METNAFTPYTALIERVSSRTRDDLRALQRIAVQEGAFLARPEGGETLAETARRTSGVLEPLVLDTPSAERVRDLSDRASQRADAVAFLKDQQAAHQNTVLSLFGIPSGMKAASSSARNAADILATLAANMPAGTPRAKPLLQTPTLTRPPVPVGPAPPSEALPTNGGWSFDHASSNPTQPDDVTASGGTYQRNDADTSIHLYSGATWDLVSTTEGDNTVRVSDATVGEIDVGSGDDEVFLGADAVVSEIDFDGGADLFVSQAFVAMSDGLDDGDDIAFLYAGGSLRGEHGDDIFSDLDFLAGNDVATSFQGDGGDDTLNIYAREQISKVQDTFDGGSGDDTIRINLNSAATSQERRDRIVAEFEAIQAAGNSIFTSNELNLGVSGVETVEIVIDGTLERMFSI